VSRDLLVSLERAVDRLEEAVGAPATDLNRDASIQRFEFCFELAWKAMQRALRTFGVDSASPKSCMRAAYRQGWIEEEPWLAMLGDRNRTSHTYDETLAQEVYARLAGYIEPLRALVRMLRDTSGEPGDLSTG